MIAWGVLTAGLILLILFCVLIYKIIRQYKIPLRRIGLVVALVLVLALCVDRILKSVMPYEHRLTKYGWMEKANCRRHPIVEDSPGQERKITVETFSHGFKRWGDVNTSKRKIFIIGASFTRMQYVSNGEEWYSFLERSFGKDFEFFVFGGAGYGTLQKFMILDDFIETIKPDMILLEFTDIDFVKNLYSLDFLSYPIVYGVRPYLEQGRVVYKTPSLLLWLRKNSFIANRLLMAYNRFKLNRFIARKERFRRGDKMALPDWEALDKLNQESFKVTDQIMTMIQKRAGAIPVYFLDAWLSQDRRGKELCEKHGFFYIPGIKEELALRKKQGVNVYGVNTDSHWNTLGNQVVGQKVVEYFEKAGLGAISQN